MIDFSLKTGVCSKYLNNVIADRKGYNPEIIKNYPFFNYLLRSGTPNNFKYGKLGILLTLFFGIIKKFDDSLVQYFDAFFYQLIKELDFTSNGLIIPKMEVNALKSFLVVISDLTHNEDLQVLSDHLNVIPYKTRNSEEAEEIIADIEMFLCHVIVRYNAEQIMQRFSTLFRMNIFEINKILIIKYFPRTFLLMQNFDAIPSEFLIYNPMQMYHYSRSLFDISKDKDVIRILELEMKIFATKFLVKKKYSGCCDLDSIRDKINEKNCRQPVRVNDTIAILHDYYMSDIDLERWTSFRIADTCKKVDIIVYYDYVSGKVRHQEMTHETKDILSFFQCNTRTKHDYFISNNDRMHKDSLLNELIYKNILL
jgi:hypothetical protein